jgi:hypothetical protein
VNILQMPGVAEAAGSDQLGACDLDAVQLAVERGFPVVEEARRPSSRLSDSVGRRTRIDPILPNQRRLTSRSAIGATAAETTPLRIENCLARSGASAAMVAMRTKLPVAVLVAAAIRNQYWSGRPP